MIGVLKGFGNQAPKDLAELIGQLRRNQGATLVVDSCALLTVAGRCPRLVRQMRDWIALCTMYPVGAAKNRLIRP